MPWDDKMKEEKNLMHDNVVGDTHLRYPTKILDKPTSTRDAIWA
jgi:hypothetical protein